MPSDPNQSLKVQGPTIQLQRRHRVANFCREVVLEVIHADGGHGPWTLADINAAVSATGATWSKPTIYQTQRHSGRIEALEESAQRAGRPGFVG